VGIRELRDNLSKYLAQVEKGAEVLITDHRRPIARLLPSNGATDRLSELIRSGAAQRAQKPKRLPKKSDLPRVSDLLATQRR
jgi:prevent-host-death family protein